MSFRIGNGFDVHQLKSGLPFNIGTVQIPYHKGIVAHSDGDILVHAICDALLGAANLGDIGIHFPSTEKFRNISGTSMLKTTVELINELEAKIENIDSTIILQAPKISTFIPKMKTQLSTILKIHENCLSIKATTTDGLGMIGNEDGIAVISSALISFKNS